MKTITPLHSRANVIPRADLHAATHKMLFGGGEVKTALFGTMRLDSTIQYTTPCKKNSFAFGQVMALGLRDIDRPADACGIEPGDIIGFDLAETGHQIDGRTYYELDGTPVPWFVTLPWKEMACRFEPGADLPSPVGWWVMVEPDPIQTRKLVFGDGGGGLYLPGSVKGGVATNGNTSTKVKLAAGKLLALGRNAHPHAEGVAEPGDWMLYNPLDAVDIDYTGGRKLAFVKWGDVEQVVAADDTRTVRAPLTTGERGALADGGA